MSWKGHGSVLQVNKLPLSKTLPSLWLLVSVLTVNVTISCERFQQLYLVEMLKTLL